MKNIVVFDADTMRGELLRPSFPHRWTEWPLTKTIATAQNRVANAHILITNKSPVTADIIAAAPHLELIAVAATGVDCIDLAACRARGVTVCNTRNYANQSVAEHVIAFIFALARGVAEHHRRTMDGEWVKSAIFSPDMGEVREVANITLGIIGAGALGRATAALAEKVGMRVYYWQRDAAPKDSLPRLPLAELLATADVVSLHCPLTAQTQGMFGQAEFAQMKRGAYFINTARGALVDSQALVEALTSGHLGGAAIDVLPTEPPPPHEPLLQCRHPRLLITPHVAWAGAQALRIFHQQIKENMEKFVAGAPQNIVP